MRNLIKISFRNYFRNFGRYAIVSGALIFAVATMVVFIGISDGIIWGINSKAGLYFSGDVTIQGFVRGKKSQIDNVPEIKALLTELQSEIPFQFSFRTIQYGHDAALYHAGNKVDQRRFIGVDWREEADILSDLSLVKGALPENDTKDVIVVSTIAATELGVDIGDEVYMSLKTHTGMLNTKAFTVAAIFLDNSLFGTASYVFSQDLNEIMLEQQDEVSEVAVYLEDSSNALYFSESLVNTLNKHFDVFPFLNSKADRDRVIKERWDGLKYAVLSLDAQLSMVGEIVTAISLVVILILAVYLIVIVVGIANTFTMMIQERIKEIGMMRALGLSKSATVSIFIIESIILSVTSSLLGMLLGIGLLEGIHTFFSIAGDSIAELFLIGGKIPWRMNSMWFCGIIAMACLSSVIGVLRPSLFASRLKPVDAIRR